MILPGGEIASGSNAFPVGFLRGGVTGSGMLMGGVRVPALGVNGEMAISVGKSRGGRAERTKSSPAKL